MKLDHAKYVRWTMFDGNVMAGKIVRENYSTYTVQRVDGSTCHVPKCEVTQATLDEVDAAIAFYTKRKG